MGVLTVEAEIAWVKVLIAFWYSVCCAEGLSDIRNGWSNNVGVCLWNMFSF